MASGRRPARDTQATCSHCGGTFRFGRVACPHCGSDFETGWNPFGDEVGGLPDEFTDEDYADVLRDLPGGANERNDLRGMTPGQRWTLAIGLLLVVVLLFTWVL